MKNVTCRQQAVRWSVKAPGPVIAPGSLNPPFDVRRAGSAHVLRLGHVYRLYYWATGEDGRNRICMAESDPATPNLWRGLGAVLEPQADTTYNCGGPSFPFVVPRSGAPWLMYFGAWGAAREGGKLPNTTGLALSDDEGLTWHYPFDRPVLPLDRSWDCEGTGSVCVLEVNGELRMYYTAIGPYFDRPAGVRTGHGAVIPRIGIGYAVSTDGIQWRKPLDDLMVVPRGFETEPYEYIASKPFVLRERDGLWRMWVHTFGYAYRVRSLVSDDGLHWQWCDAGPDGELGIGEPGAFDDIQRCYACVVCEEDEYRCWYTANGFGATGIGYAVGYAEAKEGIR